MPDIPLNAGTHPTGQIYERPGAAPSSVGSSPRSPYLEAAEHEARILDRFADGPRQRMDMELVESFQRSINELRLLHRRCKQYGRSSEECCNIQIALETVLKVASR